MQLAEQQHEQELDEREREERLMFDGLHAPVNCTCDKTIQGQVGSLSYFS